MTVWFWLEDQPEKEIDYKRMLEKLNINHIQFQNPIQAQRRLVELKEKNHHELKNIGFIIDIMLRAQPYVICPPEWHGLDNKDVMTFKTHKLGYDGGLLFYEKIILGLGVVSKPFIIPPPPVLFLTIIHPNNYDLAARLKNIKDIWNKHKDSKSGITKVEWIRKWDADERSLKSIFQAWGEI